MSYPGNSALSEDIRQRILTTFEQTVSLAGLGNRQEALLGCDFILRLDPLFEPARTLHERLQSGEGPVETGDLEAVLEESEETAPGNADELFAQLDDGLEDLDVQLDDGGELETLELAEPAAPDDLKSRFDELFVRREFQQLVELANEERERVTADPELQQTVQTALERQQAEPYVLSFLESTRKAKDQGDLESARGALAKAQELDATHPGVIEAARTLAPIETLEPAPPQAVAPEPPVPQPALDEPTPVEADLDSIPALELAPEEEPQLEVEPTPGLDGLSLEPAASLDSESEERIDELLTEGQAAFESGEYQSAIDAWSRIFLIDIDHAEANRRIELARKLKAEVERKVEEAFHDGISRLEAGAIDEAKEAFERVLERQPHHGGAREYLQKIESGDLRPGGAAPAAPAPAAPPPTPEVPPPAFEPAEEIGGEATELQEEILQIPDVEPQAEAPPPLPIAEEPAAAPKRPAKAGSSASPKRRFALIGAGVLVLVLAGLWFVFSKWDQFFPNSAVEQPAPGAARPDPIARAQRHHDEGKTAIALAQLRRLPPNHPKYAEAQALIAQWETSEEPDEPQAEGPPPEELARRDALVGDARQALDRGNHIAAAGLLEKAAGIVPLDAEEQRLQERTSSALKVVEKELRLFEQGDWEFALPDLWRLHDQYPNNRDVRQLIVDSYFNLGLRDLQRGNSAAAVEKLQEARGLAPEDREVERLATFAAIYQKRPEDLLYSIFVKYQPFR